MSITSSSSSTSRTGSTLDVSGIVSGLMEAESVPVNKLDNRIGRSTVKITALGQIKSQLSALKTSLIDLQTPANFSFKSAKFSTLSIATAEITSTATAASYQMEVTSLAQPTIWNVSGFGSFEDAMAWYNVSPEQNGLRSSADATVFQKSPGQFVLSLTSKKPGTDAAFTLENNVVPNGIIAAQYQTAQDAVFKLNGVAFTRTSNTVSDALTGITLNLASPTSTPINFTVSNDPVSAKPKLEALVKAYNDLYALYKSQTASSINTATRGILNSDFAVSSMMRQLASGLMQPITNIAGGVLTGPTDLSAIGLKLTENGNLVLDDTLLSAASNTLQSRLIAGIRIGYSGVSRGDLATQIGEMIKSGGVIQDRIENEKTTQTELNLRKTALQEKLVIVQARYTAQFASLDALLFKLQGTSDSLKSALDGLTNSQKNG